METGGIGAASPLAARNDGLMTTLRHILGSAMAALMIAFMRGMYKNRRVNLAIFGGAAAVFVATPWLVRSQATVDDVAYMRAMIPHHSIAILTSERANIADPRVRKLTDGIIATQKREIAEMKALIEDQKGK